MLKERDSHINEHVYSQILPTEISGYLIGTIFHCVHVNNGQNGNVTQPPGAHLILVSKQPLAWEWDTTTMCKQLVWEWDTTLFTQEQTTIEKK